MLKLSDDALAGAFSGFISRLTTAPFDVVKIRQQLATHGNPSVLAPITPIFRQIIREEGVLALWKGNISATYLWVGYSAIQFGMYGPLREAVEDTLTLHGYDKNELVRHSCLIFGVGSISG